VYFVKNQEVEPALLKPSNWWQMLDINCNFILLIHFEVVKQ